MNERGVKDGTSMGEWAHLMHTLMLEKMHFVCKMVFLGAFG
jgi:hypothetical protein